MLRDLVLKNRSYRRFHQEETISPDILRELVNLARLSPSARNAQPLKYIISTDREKNARIFPFLLWAAYLKEWDGPVEGERPSAYLIMLSDKDLTSEVKWDHGICAQTILLGAVEKGLGGCMIGSVNKKGLTGSLNIPSKYEIELVIALGRPREEIMIEPLAPDGDIKYWRDENSVHHVPKRALDDLILDL